MLKICKKKPEELLQGVWKVLLTWGIFLASQILDLMCWQFSDDTAEKGRAWNPLFPGWPSL